MLDLSPDEGHFLCFRLDCAPVLLECVCQMAPGQTRAFIYPLRGGPWVFLTHHKASGRHQLQGRGPQVLGVSVPTTDARPVLPPL